MNADKRTEVLPILNYHAIEAVSGNDPLDFRQRDYALSLADCWNERIEEWTFVRDTELSRRHGDRKSVV